MPAPEAPLQDDGGLTPVSAGWFVVNVAAARGVSHPTAGAYVPFDNREQPFPHYGINIHILQPGEPNALYHEESTQEDFLVLHGECLAIIEGEQRRLRRWDFVHCPPGTRHVFVGAGDGPCAILMTGARQEGATVHYPVEPLAEPYGATVPEPTDDPREAYAAAGWSREFTPGRLPWPPS